MAESGSRKFRHSVYIHSLGGRRRGREDIGREEEGKADAEERARQGEAQGGMSTEAGVAVHARVGGTDRIAEGHEVDGAGTELGWLRMTRNGPLGLQTAGSRAAAAAAGESRTCTCVVGVGVRTACWGEVKASGAGRVRDGTMRVPSSSGGEWRVCGGCGGLAAAELKKKELETDGNEETDEPEAERDGLDGGEGGDEGTGLGRAGSVRIVLVLVLNAHRRFHRCKSQAASGVQIRLDWRSDQ
ncbi:hypothetical protein C8R44DRAFT_724733 [Mycena epipterygia]|nr:hypothetical protein C8R44DRAFT_724733 [Mycena epipterygia]